MQPTNSAQALSGLQQVQAQSQDPNTILSGQREQLGVNGAQDTVTGLRGAINNTTKLLKQVAPSVMGRTGNSLVTNAQASKQIQNEQAPISQNLTEQGTQLTDADQTLNELSQRAQEAASGIYAGQQDKLSYAQNLYNTLYKQEQDVADRAFAEKQLEAARAASGPSSFDLGSGSSTPGTASQATMTKRPNGGFNFNVGGQTLNAAQYAHVTGQNFRDVLTQMAKQGDTGAQQALSFVGNDFGYDPTKITEQWQADLYKALTGNTATVKKAQPAAKSQPTLYGKPVTFTTGPRI